MVPYSPSLLGTYGDSTVCEGRHEQNCIQTSREFAGGKGELDGIGPKKTRFGDKILITVKLIQNSVHDFFS